MNSDDKSMAHSDPSQSKMPSPWSEDDERHAIDEAFSPNTKQQQEELADYLKKIRDRIRFHLVGYDVEGRECKWKEGINEILSIERKLIIDPDQLRESFNIIKTAPREERDELSLTISEFSQHGGHVKLNTAKTIERVCREGWGIVAVILLANGKTVPIGYNYGLDKIPTTMKMRGDHELMSLDKETMSDPDLYSPETTAVNYRSSVLRSIPAEPLRQEFDIPDEIVEIPIRRIAAATMTKYHMISLVQDNGAEDITLNIATVYEPESLEMGDRSVRVRNRASLEHNITIFGEEGGYRLPASRTGIIKEGPNGKREFVGVAFWYQRGEKVARAMENIRGPTSALVRKQVDMAFLEASAETMIRQRHEMRKRGDHA